MAYATRDDIENVYGADNVEKWADINNHCSALEIENRINWALQRADDRVDDRMRDGPYVVPFSPAPSTIVDVSARLAGYYLYESRGFIDPDDTTQNQVKPSYDMAERTLDDALSGRIRLNATRTANKTFPTIPAESGS